MPAELGHLAEGATSGKKTLATGRSNRASLAVLRLHLWELVCSTVAKEISSRRLPLSNGASPSARRQHPGLFPLDRLYPGCSVYPCWRIVLPLAHYWKQMLEHVATGSHLIYQALGVSQLGERMLWLGRLEDATPLPTPRWRSARTHPGAATKRMPSPPWRDRDTARASGERAGRSPLPPGPCPGRGTRHAPTPGPLPPRSREALCHERTPRRGPRRTVRRHRVVSGHGDDVLATPSRGCTGAGRLSHLL